MLQTTACLILALAAPQGVESTAHARFPNFESAQARPLALAPDGERLYVLNTPDHRVEVYLTGTGLHGGLSRLPVGGLTYLDSIFTGLEPVAIAVDPTDSRRLFVANTLSDSVSVVDVGRRVVVATVPVGDEPQDLVVAGGKVFVSTARSSVDPGAVVPGDFVENAVVVFDASGPYEVQARIELPGVRPRSLATDGTRVFVTPLHSGNHTTILSEPAAATLGLDDQTVTDAFDPPFELNEALLTPQLNGPSFLNFFGENGWIVPTSSRIVMDDEYPAITAPLPDQDLFVIDVATNALMPERAEGVGTTLLGMARNPVTGDLWVVNTEAENRRRFEPLLNGTGVENRVTVVSASAEVQDVLVLAPPLTSAAHAQPASIAFYEGAKKSYAYIGCLGTGMVVVLDAQSREHVAELAVDDLPTGLAVDEEAGVLYVFSRGTNTIQRFAIRAGHRSLGEEALAYDPEPEAVADGRRHLYDARPSTGAGNGTMSCASCHVFGHSDGMAWDLGNPEGGLGYFFPETMTGTFSFQGQRVAERRAFMTHPMKGPMVTQSLRGLGDDTAMPLHWRGDRRFFHMFRGAFAGLLGGPGFSKVGMQQFAAFVRTMAYPPNPLQPRDREYRGSEAAGRDLFGMNPAVPGKPYNPAIAGTTCIECHQGDFTNEDDFTGSQLTVNFDGEPQMFNTAQLRGLYEKEYKSLTGFGTLHDGSTDGVFGFMNVEVGGTQGFPALTPLEKRQVADFVLAWDTGTPPILGEQRTTRKTWASVMDFVTLAQAQVRPPQDDVDLIAKGRELSGVRPVPIGLLYALDATDSTWKWRSDAGEWFDDARLADLIDAEELELTFTAVPRGLGERLGIDRDEDGLFDREERLLRTSPHDPDTDDDGYDDRSEATYGGDPRAFDPSLPDGDAPVVEAAAVHSVFATTATLAVTASEAVTVDVDLGTSAGGNDVGGFSSTALRRQHDVTLFFLPAGTELHARVTVTDRSGNSSFVDRVFETAPPMLHVAEMTLTANDEAPYSVVGTAKIVDQDGNPVQGIPVWGLWNGDIGGASFLAGPPTDENGVARRAMAPFTPSGPTRITFSVAYLGSPNPSHPFFVGFGGGDASYYYNQSANAVNYVTLDLP